MIYVGTPNGVKKVAIARRKPIEWKPVPTVDLAWDCQRHVDFLRRFADSDRYPPDARLLDTDYARWLLRDRPAAVVADKADDFLRRFRIWRHMPPRIPWATVTEDGLRLDGSHRAAIALVVGHPEVWVAVVPYIRGDEPWRQRMVAWRADRLAGKEVAYE